MRVIPVIDLMRGEVVRGVGGRRDEYRPIQSILARDARPASVGQALADAGFRSTYVADLDAIAGGEPAWTVYVELMQCGLDAWVDAGVTSLALAEQLASFECRGRRLSSVIVGLESLPGPEALLQISALLGPERMVFSLDLRNGLPIAGRGWNRLDARQIGVLALRAGVRRVIVLDLAAVGMSRGVGTEPLCRELRCLDAKLELITGGGTRSTADLRSTKMAGASAVLVASALHDGRLNAPQCARMR